jgi:hypothetical protein
MAAMYLPNLISPKAQTADFRGIVQKIDVDNDNKTVFISAHALWGEDFKVSVDAPFNISCLYLDGRAFPITNIKTGDMIDFSYKGDWGLDGEGFFKGTAKWLTVYPKPE